MHQQIITIQHLNKYVKLIQRDQNVNEKQHWLSHVWLLQLHRYVV